MEWRKSSHSGSENCVEVRFLSESLQVGLRDSKHEAGETIQCSLAAFEQFKAMVAL